MVDSLESYRKAVIDTFNSQYANLSSALQGCMTKFMEEAFAVKLISESVMRSENFADIANEFKTGLKLMKTVEEIQTHCHCLVRILEDLGGPAATVGSNLATELSTLAAQYCDLSSLFSQYGLSYEEVDKECDDGVFIEVSQHMNDDYITAGHCLNLSTERVHSISQSDKSDVEKKNELLWTWKRKNGSGASYKELVKSFLKMEDRFVAESILKYLSKRMTSLPQTVMFHLAPEKAKIHYPNWKDLTVSDQEAVRNQLMDDNRDVRKAYTFFVVKLIHSFIKREVDPKIIQSTVRSYNTSEGHQQQPIVFDFRRDDSISDVFSELSKYCTWFNYDSLQVIVEALGDESERMCLKEYEDKHLIPYLKRSIFEIPCAPPHTQSQRTELLLKVSADVITGGEVKAIQRNLAKLLGFQSSAILHFHDYNEGCIELVFSLPTVVLKNSSPKSKLFTYIEWEKSSHSYKVNVDLVTVLTYSDKPEVSLLVKLLHEKEDALNELLEREKTKQKSDDMELCEPIVMQSSLSNIKYMEDLIEHEPVYHMETFYTSSSGLKRKGDHNLEDETPSKKQLLGHSMDRERPQDQSSTDTSSEKMKLLEKMSKAKTLEIEKLTRYKETTNKVLVEKQEKIEALQMEIKSPNVEVMEREESGISQLMEKIKDPRIFESKLKKTMSSEVSQLKSTQTELQKELQSLQEIITSLTLQLREKEERNVHLTENIKDLRSRILEVRDLLKTSHPKLSQKLEEPLTSKQEDIEAYELVDKMKTLEDLTSTVQEREATDRQQEITKLQEMISSLTLQLTEKDKIITQLTSKDTDEEESQEESSDDEELPGDTGSVKWTSYSVTLISSTVAECKEVIHQLKRQQHTTWSIVLIRLSPQSLLTVLTDINECKVRILDIYNTHFDSNCISQLSQVITYNKTMEVLRLISSPLLPNTYHLLTTALTNNTIIKVLRLWYDTTITDNDIPHFSHLINNNNTLQVLYLNKCTNITKFGIQKLQNVVVNNNSLKYLFVNGNSLR